MAATQQYSLRWNNYFRHLTYALDNHRTNDDFVDVSLCCDGRKIRAHKVVLSSCSSYFKEIFKENPHPHPVIIFKFIKFEDLNSIVEFMYQGEVNVQQEALQSFLQTAELLAVQGLTAEEKEKRKKSPPMPIIDEQNVLKTIPSTIRAINETTTTQSSQTIEIPAATMVQQQQHIQPQQQQQLQPQQHHLQTQQVQHIQVQQHQPQQQQHQVTPVQLQQASHHTQQTQLTNVTSASTANTAVLATTKKRKITFSDDDDNIYTTETVDYAVKDDANLVKTTEMTFLRGATVKMDIPEYIVSEVDDSQQMSDGATQQTSQDATTVGGQAVTQYTSEYEILTESEIEEKYQQTEADNAEITIEMGRLLSTSASAGSTTQPEIDDGGVKMDNKSSGGADESLICRVCSRRLQSISALRRHTASRHSQIREKKHDCIMCNKRFKTKWSLSTHNSRFHRDARVTKECIKMEFL